MKTVYDVVTAMEKRFPEQVDKTISGNGQDEAGYIAHENKDEKIVSIGWFCAGGNVGHPIMSWSMDQETEIAEQIIQGLKSGKDLDELNIEGLELLV